MIEIDAGVGGGEYVPPQAAPIEDTLDATASAPDYSAQFAQVLTAPPGPPPPDYGPDFAASIAPNSTPWVAEQTHREDIAALRGQQAPDAWVNQVMGQMGGEQIVDDFAIADETRDRAREIASGAWQDPETHRDMYSAEYRRQGENAPITEFEPGGSTQRVPDWMTGGTGAPAMDPWTIANYGREANGPNYQPGERWFGDAMGAAGERFGQSFDRLGTDLSGTPIAGPAGWMGDRLGEAGEGIKQFAEAGSAMAAIASNPALRARFENLLDQIAEQTGSDVNDPSVRFAAGVRLQQERPDEWSILGIGEKGLTELAFDPLNLVGGVGIEGALLRAGARGVRGAGRAVNAIPGRLEGAFQVPHGAPAGFADRRVLPQAHGRRASKTPEPPDPRAAEFGLDPAKLQSIEGGGFSVIRDGYGIQKTGDQYFVKHADGASISAPKTLEGAVADLEAVAPRPTPAARVVDDAADVPTARPRADILAEAQARFRAQTVDTAPRTEMDAAWAAQTAPPGPLAARLAGAAPSGAPVTLAGSPIGSRKVARSAEQTAAQQGQDAARVAQEARVPGGVAGVTPKKGAAKTAEAKAAQSAGAEGILVKAAADLERTAPDFIAAVRAFVKGKTGVSPETIYEKAGVPDILQAVLKDVGAKGTGKNSQLALLRRIMEDVGTTNPTGRVPGEVSLPGAMGKRDATKVTEKTGAKFVPGENVAEANKKVPQPIKDRLRELIREYPHLRDKALLGNKGALEELLNKIPGGRKALAAAFEEQVPGAFKTRSPARTIQNMLREEVREQHLRGGGYATSEFGGRDPFAAAGRGAGGRGSGGGSTPPPSGSAGDRYGDAAASVPPPPLTDAERAAKAEELRRFSEANPPSSKLGEHRQSGTLTPERKTVLRKSIIDAYKRDADVDPVEHLMKSGLTRGDAMKVAGDWAREKQTARAIGFTRKLLADGVKEARVAQSLVRVGFAKTADEAAEIVTSALKTADPESGPEQWINAIGFLKTSFSMMDISGAGRQARSFVFHLPTWLKEFSRSGKTLVGKGDFLERQIDLYERLVMDGWDEAGLHFRDMGSYLRGGDEAFPTGSDLAEKVRQNFGGAGRVWARLSENSNMAYVSMLNGVSGEVALNWGRAMERFGTPLTAQAKRVMAEKLNHGVGRLTAANDAKPSIGRTGWATLNFFFFSPQNRGARIAFMAKDFPEAVARVTAVMPKAISMSAKGAPGARRNPLLAAGARPADIETLQLALGYATSTAFMFAVMAQTVGIKNIDLRPGSTNYMRAELGAYGLAPAAATFLADFVGVSTQQYGGKAYIDLTNGISQDIRLVYRLLTGDYVNSKGVRKQLKWDQEYPGGRPPPYTATKNAMLLGYLLNAASPGASGMATGLGLKNDDLTDLLENPITGTMLPGIIGNLIQSSGMPYPGRGSDAKTSSNKPRWMDPAVAGGGGAPKTTGRGPAPWMVGK